MSAHSKEFWVRAADDFERFRASAGFRLLQERLETQIKASTMTALALCAKDAPGASAAAARALVWSEMEQWFNALGVDAQVQGQVMTEKERR